jgi:hypothetical protein
MDLAERHPGGDGYLPGRQPGVSRVEQRLFGRFEDARSGLGLDSQLVLL